MDHIRPQDITIYPNNGVDWVKAVPGDGNSTVESPQLPGKWWRLPKGTPIAKALVVRNDYTGHWVWEPAHDMPLADYKAALAALHADFR